METFDNGAIISKCKKETILGSGTFGTIYLVKLNKNSFALKEINLNSLTLIEKQRAFNEVSLLANLKHRNIIEYKDSSFDHVSGKLSIVMDYADFGDLSGVIAKQNGVPFRISIIISWFIQISLALQYIHSHNILHRDLKTQNIFLSGNNTIKVGDFGISRILKNEQDFANTRIGTPYYLSPEVYLGKLYNRKSDMWALGCVLFEMSTLERPFKADSLPELAVIILAGKRQPFPSWMKSGLVKQIVEDLLRLNPDQRPSTDEILAHQSFKHLVPSIQGTKEITTNILRRNAYRSPEKCLKRSASALNENNSKIPKFASRTTENEKKPRSSSTRDVPPAILDEQEVFEVNELNSYGVSIPTIQPVIVVTEYKDKSETNKEKLHSAPRQFTSLAMPFNENKTPDKFQETKVKQRFVFTRVTPPAISVAKNKSPNNFLNSEKDKRISRNTTYVVEKESKPIENSKPYELSPYEIDCGYLSEEINCSPHSTEDSVFEKSNNEIRNKLSIQKNMKNEAKIASSIISSSQSHCQHSQCHQCMIDMMWKNRIRGCVGVSRSNADYLKLKNKLLVIFGCDLFQKVYESLMQEWNGNESSHAQSSIQSFAKLLSYEQVQHLPLFMQLIQLDLMKLSKSGAYSNEVML